MQRHPKVKQEFSYECLKWKISFWKGSTTKTKRNFNVHITVFDKHCLYSDEVRENVGTKCELWKLCECLEATDPTKNFHLRIFKNTVARNNVNSESRNVGGMNILFNIICFKLYLLWTWHSNHESYSMRLHYVMEFSFKIYSQNANKVW